MPVPASATYAASKYASTMVEAVYRPIPDGVWLAVTTPESNAGGGYPELWDVWILPQAPVVDVLPFRYIPKGHAPRRIGSFGDYSPEIRDRRMYPTMQSYCQRHYVGKWYRHRCASGIDGCLDVYWQTPQMLYGPVWNWYVMMDECEPAEYWRGRMMYFNGQRDMGSEAVLPSML